MEISMSEARDLLELRRCFAKLCIENRDDIKRTRELTKEFREAVKHFVHQKPEGF